MKLTKYEHACFIVEEQGQKLIVDPGGLTELPSDVSGVAAVIFTHNHFDHYSEENLAAIRTANPDVQVYGAKEIVAVVSSATEPARGHAYQVGPFTLQFYGELHESVRPGLPQITNLAVCINSAIAYPGDSYAQFGKKLRVVLAPTNAPWLHVRDAYSFVANAQADIIVPTHDGLLSDDGKDTYDAHLRAAAESASSQYHRLKTGESIEI